MRIVTNVGLASHWRASSGCEGEAVKAHTLREFLAALPESDVVLVDCNPGVLLALAALFTVLPRLRRPLLGSDIVLRQPESLRSWLTHPCRRFLLGRVDHYFRTYQDTRAVQKYFGIGPEQSTYYPFKPNLRYHCDEAPQAEGAYVLCLGRSMRDFDSFFKAMELTGLPGAIAEPDLPRLRANGSRFTRPLARLPANVRRLPHNPDDHASQAAILREAKLVVVALRKSCLVATGTPYNAMLLGKCVLVTEGPATNGMFTDEVLTMPAEDPAGMARVIERAWNDATLRTTTAARGHALALTLGGTPEMKQRLLDLTVAWMDQGGSHTSAHAASARAR
ncbi:MAG: glycosyltransferase [Terriglobales bacterium]